MVERPQTLALRKSQVNSLTQIHTSSVLLFNSRMDIDEIRRRNIRALEATHGASFLAQKADMSLTQFYNLRDGAKDSRTGKPRGMRKETAWRIEDAAGVVRGYLDVLHDTETAAATNVIPSTSGMHRIPLISYVQAGEMTEIVDPYAIGAAAEWLLTDLDLSANAFALKIKGDSMLPEFREGDTVIIDPAVLPLPGDYVVAKNGSNEATFKKYRPRGINEQGQDVFELIPLNEDYAPMRSDLTPIRIIGTMVEHRRYRRR
jgi:SOS-response transcriptional repressor LexA